MKVVVLGAGGIIGQHMALCVPHEVDAVFYRRVQDLFFKGVDLADDRSIVRMLDRENPDVVINLAGESDVDKVERDPEKYAKVNVEAPLLLASWCGAQGRRLIHISSQAVFPGNEPPYHADDAIWPTALAQMPVNAYGVQKAQVDDALRQLLNVTILRPTFILGVRPIPSVGRKNPVEQMLEGQTVQVNDRKFSVLFAREAAELIWEALESWSSTVIHLGRSLDFLPFTRYAIAKELGIKDVQAVPHSSFPGIAPRPLDTTYSSDALHLSGPGYSFLDGIQQCLDAFTSRKGLGVIQRIREIALFLRKTEAYCYWKLSSGFTALHNAVREDFLKAEVGDDDAKLLTWYRETEAYIWELSAYHCDPGFNYQGMCRGIADRLRNDWDGPCRSQVPQRVLCLGDGIGDLSMILHKSGAAPTYHDLENSLTADFARFRFWMYGMSIVESLSPGWEPGVWHDFESWISGKPHPQFHAIVALDFLEHVPNVEDWVEFIWASLAPNGLFCAQNAFNMGSGPTGSIPMHLSRNDHWEKDWDPLLFSLGFVQESSNWYRKPDIHPVKKEMGGEGVVEWPAKVEEG